MGSNEDWSYDPDALDYEYDEEEIREYHESYKTNPIPNYLKKYLWGSVDSEGASGNNKTTTIALLLDEDASNSPFPGPRIIPDENMNYCNGFMEALGINSPKLEEQFEKSCKDPSPPNHTKISSSVPDSDEIVSASPVTTESPELGATESQDYSQKPIMSTLIAVPSSNTMAIAQPDQNDESPAVKVHVVTKVNLGLDNLQRYGPAGPTSEDILLHFQDRTVNGEEVFIETNGFPSTSPEKPMPNSVVINDPFLYEAIYCDEDIPFVEEVVIEWKDNCRCSMF